MNNVFANEKNIGVAVSGGLDSVCLLYLCCEFAKKYNKNIVCMHVHHSLRRESDEELCFVRDLAKKLGVKFSCKKVNVPELIKTDKLGTEEAARKLRYAALKEMAFQNQVNFVCLAHHSSDQAETVLLNLLRGSGVAGAVGMKKASGMFIRPLLDMSKKQLVDFALKNKLNYVSDDSNQNLNYARNYLRLEIFPKLNVIQKKSVEHFCGFAKKMQSVEDLINSMVDLPKKLNKYSVLLSKFYENDILWTKYVYLACNLLDVYFDIEEKHIFALKKLFTQNVGKRINLPHNITAWKEQNGIVLSTKNEHNACVDFKLGQIEFDDLKIIVKNCKATKYKRNCIYADLDKIPNDAKFRTARTGDIFKKLNAPGNKKLSDYFIDKKINKRERKHIILLTEGNNVLAVLQHDVSDLIKIDKNTKNIIKIEIVEAKI